MLTAAQEEKARNESDWDNNVDQAFGDVHHFLLIEDKDVRSGDESMFDDPSFREFSPQLLNDRREYETFRNWCFFLLI